MIERRMNHWKPRGNCFVGDCMPFYKDEVFHLYYLLDVGHHNHPIVGALGGHQYAHATSTDLVTWKHENLALKLDFDNGECSNCTGSILPFIKVDDSARFSNSFQILRNLLKVLGEFNYIRAGLALE